jgi:hypothetical protein
MCRLSTRPSLWRIALLAGLAACPLSRAVAQDGGQPFSALGTPTSPAFTLLDVAATAIERPTTPADVAVKVNNATEQFSTLPGQFALEVAPYWLVGRPGLAWSDDVRRSPAESLARTFTASVATTSFGSEVAPGTGLAVGASASPFSGHLSDSTQAQIRRLETALTGISEQFEARVRERRDALRAAYAGRLAAASTDEEREQLRQELEARSAALNLIVRDEIAAEVAERLTPFEGFEPVREGLFVTLAGGAAWAFPDAAADAGTLGQWGAWGTFSYRAGPWSPIALVRFLHRPNRTPLTNDLPEDQIFDVGARLVYSAGDVGLSAEYVLRNAVDGGDAQHRFVGAVEYSVGGHLWLIASFGRDHDASAAGSLVALLGLSVNLSRARYTLPD